MQRVDAPHAAAIRDALSRTYSLGIITQAMYNEKLDRHNVRGDGCCTPFRNASRGSSLPMIAAAGPPAAWGGGEELMGLLPSMTSGGIGQRIQARPRRLNKIGSFFALPALPGTSGKHSGCAPPGDDAPPEEPLPISLDDIRIALRKVATARAPPTSPARRRLRPKA